MSSHIDVSGSGTAGAVRRLLVALIATILFLGGTLGVAAQSQPYASGEEIGSSGYGEGLTYATYAVVADDAVYQYATGADGAAYYTSYDGSTWSDWQTWADQPGDVTYDPAPVDYAGVPHVFYTGTGGELYHVGQDDSGAAVWEDVAGDYSFAAAPAASSAWDAIQLYGHADDGSVYQKSYTTDAGWSEWVAVSDETSAGKAGAEPYAVQWGGYDNVFWTGDDGTVSWNRYAEDGTWTGATPIESPDYQFGSAIYAVGYEPEEALYAYSTTTDGAPAYNVFDGEAWSGWTAWETSWQGTGQPTAYSYQDAQHVVYTAADGQAYYLTYAAGAYADEWIDLGGNYGYDAQQYEYDDTLYLTYTGADGKPYYRAWDGAAADPSPSSTY